ncbi:MAG: Ig-like domain-containing protein [Methanosarcinales archaeon]|nr:Ig-like domain-containing protein [Methanosarcinales archaeon]
MNKQRTVGMIISLIILIVSMQAVYAAPAITVEPESLSVMPGDTFTVNIVVDPDGTEIMGAECKVFFDNTMLEAINQDNGTFLSQDGASTNPLVNKINNTVGIIEYGEMRISVDYGVTTPGTLTEIQFEVLNSGSAELILSDVVMSNPDAEEIQGVIVNNATVEITQSQIQPTTPFLISGHIFNEDSSDCNNPIVVITNQDNNKEWTAESIENSNFYTITLDSNVDITADEILQINATNPDGSKSKVMDHTVTQNEMDAGGFNLDITFETGVEDTTPPVINDVTLLTQDPHAGSWISIVVNATDNVGVTSVTVNDETFNMRGSASDLWDGAILAVEGTHPLNVSACDAAGLCIWDNSTTYTTIGGDDIIPPTITSRSPDGADIPIDTVITVTFDEAMNQSSTEAAFSINTTVSGTFTWTGNTMNFDPELDLNEETTYTVNISTQAEDLAGNALENPYTWEFTTVTDVPPINTTVSIEDVTLDPGESILVPVMINYVDNLADCTIEMEYNASVVHVTGIEKGDMDYLVCNINNGTGWMYASALNTTGLSGDIIFAYINFTAVGSKGDESPLNITVVQLLDTGYAPIDHLVIDGTFTIEADNKPPVVTDATVSRDIILSDNARLRTPGTNITTINVTVTDTDSGIASVTIDLLAIGGSAEQAMEQIPETDIWTVTTNAVDGINLTHQLDITATDDDGNINDSISVTLTVLRRGDVFRDNVVDSKDVMYIARYLAGLEPEFSNPPTMLVADVVGIYGAEEGDGIINRMDVLYIARFVEQFEGEP